MNDLIKPLQRQLGLKPDGLRGPLTTAAILDAADGGKLTVAGIAPVTATPVLADLPWMIEAKSVFGLHEVRDNARLREWLYSDGARLGDPKKLPWCGDFVETAMKRGLPSEPFTGVVKENPYFARNWLVFGKRCEPIYGAVMIFERGPASGHVAFAVGQDEDDFYTLGGNQGDSVSITRIAKHRLLGARWPTLHPYNPVPLPRMTAGSIPKSVNEI